MRKGKGTDSMAVLTRPDLAVRRAAVRATLAPSVHNTQPWRFLLGAQSLEIHADLRRRLPVLDPTGRQLLISCGCALFNARVSLAANGYQPRVQRQPDPAEPALVARLSFTADGRSHAPPNTSGGQGELTSRQVHDPAPLAALDPVVELRRTNRRAFAADPVPKDLLDALERAAAQEGTVLARIDSPQDKAAAAALIQRADRQQNADPAYRAELRAWTSQDPDRADRVSAIAVPATARTRDDQPTGDGSTRGTGELLPSTWSSTNQCLLLLGTAQDNAAAWIRAGEGLQRVLLEITRHGFTASSLTQVIEIPNTRQALRHQLRLSMHPHILLRVGRAGATPAPRRRRLVDMLRDDT